jgi:hypothetical protein
MRFIALLLFFSGIALGQDDRQFARDVIRDLTQKSFSGRGYVKNGSNKAAKYISTYFKEKQLLSFTPNSYYQPFSISVNTFSKKMELSINDKLLKPGIHYLIRPESTSGKGNLEIVKKDSVSYTSNSKNLNNKLVVIKKVKKLTWGVSTTQENYIGFDVLADSLKDEIKTISFKVDQQFFTDYELKNVCAYIKGKTKSDSFLVFTAHYDHLGNMGKKTFFPGANDNASGVSMLFSLIDYYKKNPPNYSVAFICFAAEEAGLLGSKYYIENPLFPISQIKFLINLDLLGTGDEGITVVNATEYKTAFESLKSINEKQQLLPTIKPRGKAANSDHYWFTEKGVPSFFIYTLGGIKAYHDIYDVEKTLPLTKFPEVKKLLIEFANWQMN